MGCPPLFWNWHNLGGHTLSLSIAVGVHSDEALLELDALTLIPEEACHHGGLTVAVPLLRLGSCEILPSRRTRRLSKVVPPPVIRPERLWRIVRIAPLEGLAERVVAV